VSSLLKSTVWSVQIDGPGLQSGLRSKEYLTPLRPIIVAPPPQEWVYKTTLFKERKSTAIAEVQAKLPKQTFCPGIETDPFSVEQFIQTHS
jgi:hypothetical protein